MRIAIPVSDSTPNVAEQFSGASTFALYDVHDETRAVAYIGREKIEDPACSRTPGFLRGHKVEVIMAHEITANAEQHLLEAGILAIKGTPELPPDALIAHLVSGTLQATAPGTGAEASACGSGGCGGCCGGGQSHAHSHEPEAAVAAGGGCGSHKEAGQGCCH